MANKASCHEFQIALRASLSLSVADFFPVHKQIGIFSGFVTAPLCKLDTTLKTSLIRSMSLLRLLRDFPDTVLLDTRSSDAYELLRVAGSSHLPSEQIETRAAELPPKGCALFVIAEPNRLNVVSSSLQRLRYTELRVFESTSALWDEIRRSQRCASKADNRNACGSRTNSSDSAC